MCLSVLVGGGFVCCFVLWDFFVRFFYKLKCKEAAPASGSRIPRCICFDIKVRFFFSRGKSNETTEGREGKVLLQGKGAQTSLTDPVSAEGRCGTRKLAAVLFSGRGRRQVFAPLKFYLKATVLVSATQKIPEKWCEIPVTNLHRLSNVGN